MTNADIPRQAEHITRRHARRWWPSWAYPPPFVIDVRRSEAAWTITVTIYVPPTEKPADVRYRAAQKFR